MRKLSSFQSRFELNHVSYARSTLFYDFPLLPQVLNDLYRNFGFLETQLQAVASNCQSRTEVLTLSLNTLHIDEYKPETLVNGTFKLEKVP